jgi:hypothetical protein
MTSFSLVSVGIQQMMKLINLENLILKMNNNRQLLQEQNLIHLHIIRKTKNKQFYLFFLLCTFHFIFFFLEKFSQWKTNNPSCQWSNKVKKRSRSEMEKEFSLHLDRIHLIQLINPHPK